MDGSRRLLWLRLGALGVAATVALAIVLVTGRGGSSSGGSATAGASTATESFVLPELNGGGQVRLADYRGKPVVVDFFASWCTACQGELPGFARVSQALQGRVTFIGVNSLETGDGLAMARQYGVTSWPLARDVEGTNGSGLHDALGETGMPVSAIYDAQGHLRYVSPGAVTEDQLKGLLRQYLGITV